MSAEPEEGCCLGAGTAVGVGKAWWVNLFELQSWWWFAGLKWIERGSGFARMREDRLDRQGMRSWEGLGVPGKSSGEG